MDELSKLHDRLKDAKGVKVQEQQNKSIDKKPNKLQSMVHCDVCELPYTDPQILNCQHSFCRKCLKSLKVKYKQEVKCSICDDVTALNDVRADINKEQLIEVYHQQKQEDNKRSENDENRADFVVHAGSDIYTSKVPSINLYLLLCHSHASGLCALESIMLDSNWPIPLHCNPSHLLPCDLDRLFPVLEEAQKENNENQEI